MLSGPVRVPSCDVRVRVRVAVLVSVCIHDCDACLRAQARVGCVVVVTEGGVVVDMAYKPAQTPLLRLARTQQTWKPVLGVEVLLEQAYAQFMHWTDRRVPREPVAKTVWNKYHEQQ